MDLSVQFNTERIKLLNDQVSNQKAKIADLQDALLNYKPIVTLPIETNVAQITVNHLNNAARDKYESMSDHFKSLVPRESQLLALLMSWNDTKKGFCWESQKSLALTQAFLRTAGNFQCENCHQFYLNPVIHEPLHKKVCQSKAEKRKPDLGSFFKLDLLGKGTFTCHLGCDISTQFKTPIKIAKHFLDCHSSEDLVKWNIKADILLSLIENHRKLPGIVSEGV